MHKQFMLQYNSLMEKLDKFYNTTSYKNFTKTLKIKKFVFPLKEYFGPEKQYTYQFFKKMVDDFELEVKNKLKK